jgi:hypothetical protein
MHNQKILKAAHVLQERPSDAERLKDRQVSDSSEDAIYGIRMGAGDHSYLVRDRKIDVLRNVRGGVEVCNAELCS